MVSYETVEVSILSHYNALAAGAILWIESDKRLSLALVLQKNGFLIRAAMEVDDPNFHVWTLEEALRRLPNCELHLRNGELLAWGRLRDPESELSSIPASLWLASSFQRSRKARTVDVLLKGAPVFDLRIFPVLESPNRVEHLGHISLKDLFNRFVVGDPEVQHLAEAAILQAPELREVYRPSNRNDRCFWPLDPNDLTDIGEPTDPKIEGYFHGYVSTPETIETQDVLRSRYGAMIAALQRGDLVAIGDPVRVGDSQEILPTIWGAPGYHLDRRTGDVLQDRDWGDVEFETTPMPDNREQYELRWRAVLIKPANSVPATARSTEVTRANYNNKFEERYCRAFDYLCQQLRESPDRRPKAKDLIFRDAKSLCGPNLGWDIFCKAWEDAKVAVPEARAAWSRPGAPKKKSY